VAGEDVDVTLLGTTLMLLQCPGLAGSAHHAAVVAWLRGLALAGGAGRREYGEMLLLLGIHMHGSLANDQDAGAAVAAHVRATLAMHVQLHRDSLARMRDVFMAEVLPEARVAAQAVAPDIDNDMAAGAGEGEPADTSLRAHCVYRLLQGDVFGRHGVAVKPWVLGQVRACRAPVPSILPALIDTYIACLASRLERAVDAQAVATHLDTAATDVPTDADIRDVFAGGAAAQLLVVYFVLGYNERIAALRRAISPRSMYWTRPTPILNRAQPKCAPAEPLAQSAALLLLRTYPPELLDALPIKPALNAAHARPADYEAVYPGVLSRVVAAMPHLVLVTDLLARTATATPEACAPAQVGLSFVRAQLPALLAAPAPTHSHAVFRAMWMRVSATAAHLLWVETINVLAKVCMPC
jgi:hypothetical protein